MVDSRAKRLQIVLTLAEQKEQEVGKQLSQQRVLVGTEEQQLRELDIYTQQYLQTYSARKVNVMPQELIAYSGFIQRLGEACKEQQTKLEHLNAILDKIQQRWHLVHHKCESIKELIQRLEREDGLVLDKHLQKELDEWVGQEFSRRDPS